MLLTVSAPPLQATAPHEKRRPRHRQLTTAERRKAWLPVILSLLACGTAGPGGVDIVPIVHSGRREIRIQGTLRSFIVSEPVDYEPSHAYPLVFAFHGTGDSGAVLSTKWYFKVEFASESPAIFVYPDGLDARWENADGQDVAFFDAMLATLRLEYNVDIARVFAIGPSAGGIMVNTLACLRATELRAIASVAAAWPYSEPQCTGPISAWLAHGNPDPVVDYAEGLRARDRLAVTNQCQLAAGMPVAPLRYCVSYDCATGHLLTWCSGYEGHEFPDFAAVAIRRFIDSF